MCHQVADPYEDEATIETDPLEGFAASEPLAQSVSGETKLSLWARLKQLFRPRYS